MLSRGGLSLNDGNEESKDTLTKQRTTKKCEGRAQIKRPDKTTMRKTKPKKRILLPDPKFGDVQVTRFVNNLMLDGKKSIAYTIFYDSLNIIGEKMKDADKAPVEVWKQALENITPQVEVKSRRVGGATFQVPMEVRPERKVSISMKNLVLYSRKRAGRSMAEKLAGEIMAAYNQEGAAYKRKEEMHRMADANKAFAHFRF